MINKWLLDNFEDLTDKELNDLLTNLTTDERKLLLDTLILPDDEEDEEDELDYTLDIPEEDPDYNQQLEKIPIHVIETFIRKKKLEKINKNSKK